MVDLHRLAFESWSIAFKNHASIVFDCIRVKKLHASIKCSWCKAQSAAFCLASCFVRKERRTTCERKIKWMDNVKKTTTTTKKTKISHKKQIELFFVYHSLLQWIGDVLQFRVKAMTDSRRIGNSFKRNWRLIAMAHNPFVDFLQRQFEIFRPSRRIIQKWPRALMF